MTIQQPDPQAAAVALAFQQQSQAVRAQLVDFITALWSSLGQYRDKQMRAFVGEILPVVLGAQQHMVSLTSSYLATQQQLAVGGLGLPYPIDPKRVTGAASRGGVAPADVYERPFHQVWRQLHELPRESGSIDRAIQAGLDRAVELGQDDLQLTKVQTNQRLLARDTQVTGYRRVLEGAHSCGLCIVASTQRYHREQLMPIHGGCDCSIAPIYGDQDPGQLVDLDTVADVHDRIEQRFGASSSAARSIPGTRTGTQAAIQYRDVLITHEHGELGAVLGVLGQPFTGPSDL